MKIKHAILMSILAVSVISSPAYAGCTGTDKDTCCSQTFSTNSGSQLLCSWSGDSCYEHNPSIPNNS